MTPEIEYPQGCPIKFTIAVPKEVKRLAFVLGALNGNPIPEYSQVVDNPTGKPQVIEFEIGRFGTGMLSPGFYAWRVMALASDGSRDTVLPFTEGKFKITKPTEGGGNKDDTSPIIS